MKSTSSAYLTSAISNEFDSECDRPLPNLNAALAWATSALRLERLDAQRLLLLSAGRPPDDRAWLLAHDTDPLAHDAARSFTALCRRRLAGEPMAYLTGRQEFFGLDLRVDARVLVPRPDTETLVAWGIDALIGVLAPSVLDLGTGSGAIALAVQHARPDACVEAVDASAEALSVAQANARRLSLPVRFRLGDWFTGTIGRRDLIVSNPPYVADGDPHLLALGHEPEEALTAGPQGLDDLQSIVAGAGAHLTHGGWLLLEHGHDQAQPVRRLLRDAGFADVGSRRDLAGIERCSGGQWQPPG